MCGGDVTGLGLRLLVSTLFLFRLFYLEWLEMKLIQCANWLALREKNITFTGKET